MPRRRTWLARSLLLAAAAPLAAAGCGLGQQNRPDVVSTFPAAGQVLAGMVAYVRIVYDQPVRVLNERSVAVTAYPAAGAVGIPTRSVADPADDHAIIVQAFGGGHWQPNALHHVVVQQGAVVNGDDHYRLDEYGFTFTTGPAPDLFVACDDGRIHEIDRGTGAAVATTNPVAGTLATQVLGTDGRLWAWLDPIVPGSSLLGTFTPGTATIVQTVALAGETGTRAGAHLALSADGKTVYATARDLGANRLLIHRVDVGTLAEVGTPLVLSTPTQPGPASVFQVAVDSRRERLYASFSDGLGGGFVGVVDLLAFAEIDAGPGAGVDALPLPAGPGPLAYEDARDVLYALSADQAFPGFVYVRPDDFAEFPTSEPAITGAPVAILPTADGLTVVEALSGYPGLAGLVTTDAGRIGEGFALDFRDDVGGVLQGSTEVGVLLSDPWANRFYAFANDGADTVMGVFDYAFNVVTQEDLDSVTAGVQAVSLTVSAPGVVVGATTLLGQTPP